MTTLVPQVWKMSKLVLKVLKMEKYKKINLLLFMNGIIGPCDNIMIFTGSVPQKSKYYNIGPWALNTINHPDP